MDLPVLARVGRDSLPILETHKFVVVVVQVLAIRVGLANHGNESVTVVLLGILGVCVCMLIRPWIQVIWPRSIGRVHRAGPR